MMGTLAAALARKEIKTSEDLYRAEVEGDIENVNGILKITQIRVDYHLTTKGEKAQDAREAFASYINSCPAAQSVIGCIGIKDNLILHGKE
jgi:organic hydroperoxide reductase OsmC/OhrA